MGGHSHTLLGDMEDAEGKYPTIVKNKDGDEVFIVTAYRWGEYVGYIDVTYDPEGKILAYHGAPIHMTNTTEQDEELQEQIDEWRVPFEEFAAEVLGESKVNLDQTTCQKKECLLGDFVADAMYDYRKENSDPDFALVNAGGIRATIDEGPITRGEVLTSFPFGNAIVDYEISGKDLWDVLEGIMTRVNVKNGEEVTSFVQVSSNIKIQYNPENANNTKLVSVNIGGEDLKNDETYTVVTLDFLAGGGDNFFEPATGFASLDTLDEVLTKYIEKTSPVDIKLDGRIEEVDGQRQGNGGGNGTNSTAPDFDGGAAAGQKAAAMGVCVLAALVSVFVM